MVVILACLSLILTAGGGAMALYGADLIRSESGLALTQSGITMLSAGLVLAGLTTAVVELRRMRRLMELEEPLAPPAAQPAAPSSPPPPRVAETPLPPVVAPVPAPVVPEPTVARSAPAGGEPSPALPPLPPMPERRPAASSGIPAEAKASLVGSAAMRGGRSTVDEVASGAAAGPPSGSTDQAAPDDAGAPEPETAVASPATSVGAATSDGDMADATEDTAETKPSATGERKMLATYNSGGITYFMFSDGSIEADMTGGRFRFTSMDELRGYIDTGKGGVLVGPAAPAGATG